VSVLIWIINLLWFESGPPLSYRRHCALSLALHAQKQNKKGKLRKRNDRSRKDKITISDNDNEMRVVEQYFLSSLPYLQLLPRKLVSDDDVIYAQGLCLCRLSHMVLQDAFCAYDVVVFAQGELRDVIIPTPKVA
jgi:hypothetical protein